MLQNSRNKRRETGVNRNYSTTIEFTRASPEFNCPGKNQKNYIQSTEFLRLAGLCDDGEEDDDDDDDDGCNDGCWHGEADEGVGGPVGKAGSVWEWDLVSSGLPGGSRMCGGSNLVADMVARRRES